MRPKVLIADDSSTIQKVIQITLANEDYELFSCEDEQELFKLAEEIRPNLVLLDFNLSEEKTGYDLASEVKRLGAKSILMLYGTFDTIDENLLAHCGCKEYVVKPFEGANFISLCRMLVGDFTESETTTTSNNEFMEESEDQTWTPDEKTEEIEIGEDWVVHQNAREDFDESDNDPELESITEDSEETKTNTDGLSAQMEEWGIEIPQVISSEEHEVEEGPTGSEIELPPVIEASDQSLPEEDDLDYPDVDLIRSTIESEVTPKLVPLEDLADEEDASETKVIALDDTLGTKTEEEVRSLEEQIADETDDYLWSVDDEDTVSIEDSSEDNAFNINEDQQTASAPAASISSEEIDAKIEELVASKLQSIIEQEVEKRVQSALEKVAWEVIPELAENLVTKELKRISDEVLRTQNRNVPE